ncbi:hypothetical protein PAPHI01_2475 [Pancytospora philotis]|nr:hypothetical protein PAPHI01_2475 [Pancytospora philotis]
MIRKLLISLLEKAASVERILGCASEHCLAASPAMRGAAESMKELSVHVEPLQYLFEWYKRGSEQLTDQYERLVEDMKRHQVKTYEDLRASLAYYQDTLAFLDAGQRGLYMEYSGRFKRLFRQLSNAQQLFCTSVLGSFGRSLLPPACPKLAQSPPVVENSTCYASPDAFVSECMSAFDAVPIPWGELSEAVASSSKARADLLLPVLLESASNTMRLFVEDCMAAISYFWTRHEENCAAMHRVMKNLTDLSDKEMGRPLRYHRERLGAIATDHAAGQTNR